MSVQAPKHWYNVVPYIEKTLGLTIPELLDPKTGESMKLETLARILPTELAKQELGIGIYKTEAMIPIPASVQEKYESFRPTPLVRAEGLERELGLGNVKIFYKREDTNKIGSYKLNSSYAQAFYAKEDGVKEFIGDTGPGNWGLGMALACKEYGIPATIYMEEKNYLAKKEKVDAMRSLGADVKPITTKEGTIAASLSIAVDHVLRDEKNKLSLGCLTAYSALHNTVIGLELDEQMKELGIVPNVVVGVVGGGSSFSGLVFPLLEKYRDSTRFVAVESESVPSFSKGEYRYENPDLIGLMPRAKMYTLGNAFVPKNLGASGLNYHGKNPLLSLLVHEKHIEAKAYGHDDVDPMQKLFLETEGIKPAAESCYAILGAIEEAKILAKNGGGVVVFSLTGNANSLEHL